MSQLWSGDSKDRIKRCPHCAERTRGGASNCENCRRELGPKLQRAYLPLLLIIFALGSVLVNHSRLGDSSRTKIPPSLNMAGVDLPALGVEPNDVDMADFVASDHSKIYHLSAECRDAKWIKAPNLLTGMDAFRGRSRHIECPRQ